MDKTIYIMHEDTELECVVEYVEYLEDGTNVQEVTAVFLPDGVQHLEKKTLGDLKVKACDEFHASH